VDEDVRVQVAARTDYARPAVGAFRREFRRVGGPQLPTGNANVSIFEALRPFGELTGAHNPEAVRAVLEAVAHERVAEEARLRIKRVLPIGRLEIDPDHLADPDAAAAEQTNHWVTRLRTLDLVELTKQARFEVETIIAAGTQLERFHGKRLLQAVHQRLQVNQAELSQPAFATSVADKAAGSERLRRITEPAITRITLYVPDGLATAIEATENPAAEPLAQQCRHHRDLWNRGQPEAAGREELRRQIFAFARTLDQAHRSSVAALAAEIGTP
jgi:hypothetical protein